LLKLQQHVIRDTTVANGVIWVLGTQGNYTGDNTNSLSLWQWDGSSNWVKVVESANDALLYQTYANNTKITTAFVTPVTVYPNQIYDLGYIYNNSAQVTAPQPNCHTAPTSIYAELNGSTNPRLNSYISTATTNESYS